MKEFNPEKEYKKLNRKFTKKHLLIITSVILVLAVIGISFANYSVNPDSILIIDSKVGEFTTGDINLSVLVNGEKSNSFPSKDSGYVYAKTDCDNGSTATWDNSAWALNLKATGPDKCTVYFGKIASTMISELAKTNTATMNTDDPDNNVRYMGSNPNNYVLFNDELWRIIGVFDTFECSDEATVETYTSKCSNKKLLKIIRNDSIGIYSWDSSETAVNSGYGVNEWSQADLNLLLNNYYYNGEKNQTCYYWENNNKKDCSFDTNGIKKENRDMIANILWYTGTINGDWSQIVKGGNAEVAGAKAFYDGERSANNGKSLCISGGAYCTDQTERTMKWIGKIGLMYPSDYGFATSGGNSKSRKECLNQGLYNWGPVSDDKNEEFSECYINDWLFIISPTQWTITSVPYKGYANLAFYVGSLGNVEANFAYMARAVRPVVYLKSNVQIMGGKGTEQEPYTLSTNN